MTIRLSDEEIELIRQLAPTHSQREIAERLGMASETVRRKMRENGISPRTLKQYWDTGGMTIRLSDGEIELIRQLAPTHSQREIAARFGMSSGTVLRKMREHGISPRTRKQYGDAMRKPCDWEIEPSRLVGRSPAVLRSIRALKGVYSAREAARMFKTTRNAIIGIWHRGKNNSRAPTI